MHDPIDGAVGGGETAVAKVAHMIPLSGLVQLVALPTGFALLPITLGIEQVLEWTNLGKTKIQDLINAGRIETSKVDGRTLVHTVSVVALIERHRVPKHG